MNFTSQMSKNESVLLTGVSSFTGMHFASSLLDDGREVVGFSRNLSKLTEIQQTRLTQLRKKYKNLRILETNSIKSLQGIEIICLHGANTKNYKSPSFDKEAALESFGNVANNLIENLKPSKILFTSSYFEKDVASGADSNLSFNEYSNFKTSAWEYLQEKYANELAISRYVIPTPFGPYEEKRLVWHLLQGWNKNGVAELQSPLYIRDYVPVSILSKHYNWAVGECIANKKTLQFSPSFYAESNISFAQRYGLQLQKRIDLRTDVKASSYEIYNEPLVRVNKKHIFEDMEALSEDATWDEVIEEALKLIDRITKTRGNF
jgi:UDP-glucose 4-epimerase